ncbi:hypothetical protein SAMN04488057_11911 [Cyclobacterium lianum]|uniref:Uncharacterized protein n=1 Tax=Cyclobacterium lianum TaxID=388280 RepID=A0A1M7QJM4_9BACT|nr:hypothetical protein SAMN04488057_11911 [Cyclobacterium lianum]
MKSANIFISGLLVFLSLGFSYESIRLYFDQSDKEITDYIKSQVIKKLGKSLINENK